MQCREPVVGDRWTACLRWHLRLPSVRVWDAMGGHLLAYGGQYETVQSAILKELQPGRNGACVWGLRAGNLRSH